MTAQPLFTPLVKSAWWRQLPGQCAVCHGWGRGRVCGTCTARFATPVDRCSRCAIRVPPDVAVCGTCLRSPPAFASALAAVDYAYPWDSLIGNFKFHGGLDLAETLTGLLLTANQQRIDADCVAKVDLMLPVPLGRMRLRQRGYNQSWELVQRLAPRLSCEAQGALLLRIKETPHQISLPREQRAANVRGAFAIEPTRRAEVRGRHIALVDDVMTTQATASEIAQLLLTAGATAVHVWVVARTPRPGD